MVNILLIIKNYIDNNRPKDRSSARRYKITLWVNPDNPYNFINSREINLIDIVVTIAIPIGIMLFGVLGLVFNLKKEK